MFKRPVYAITALILLMVVPLLLLRVFSWVGSSVKSTRDVSAAGATPHAENTVASEPDNGPSNTVSGTSSVTTPGPRPQSRSTKGTVQHRVPGAGTHIPSLRLARRVKGRPAFLSGPAVGDPIDVARAYLDRSTDELGLTPGDLRDMELLSSVTSEHNGVTHLYYRQRLDGVEVARGDLSIHLDREGRVLNVGSSFVSDLANRVNVTTPAITQEQALVLAARHLRHPMPEAPVMKERKGGPAREVTFDKGSLSLDDIPVKLMYLVLAQDGVALTWDVRVNMPDGLHYWVLKVDAVEGTVLAQDDWVVNESHEAYAMPLASPADGARTIEIDAYTHAPGPASPFGWHDTDGTAGPEYTITRGNNVHAYEDSDANNASAGNEPDAGPGLVFTNAIDLSQQPSTYLDASVVNLFYWNNICHDVFHPYGFDEASGNFQENNYGNGGAGGDPVRAEGQDGAGFNNANFLTLNDGSKPRMQMFLGNNVSPMRDGDLDNLVVVHEYCHGVSTRLTGGGANSACLQAIQSGGMGEGWSDWFGLVLTVKPGDAGTDARPVGTWLFGQAPDGDGIRAYPYSTDMAIDPDTYANIQGVSSVHRVGTVWCAALWDLYWNLVDLYGFDPDIYNGAGGNNMALQLVMDGLKLQPCGPTLLDARDAILQADTVNYGGVHQELIWQTFARRGMGLSADDGGSDSTTSVTEAFDIPDFGMRVVGSTPAHDAIVAAPPTNIVITFSDDYDTNTVATTDLDVNGVTADSLLLTGSSEVTYLFTVSPVTNEGLQTMAVSSNTVIRLSDGEPVAAWTVTFRYDALPLAVTSSVPADGAAITLPFTNLVLMFSEPVAADSVGTDNLALSQGMVTSATNIDATTIAYTLSGVGTEELLTVDLAAGELTDLYGNAGEAYSGNYAPDYGLLAWPAPLTAVPPRGSLVYESAVSAAIGFTGDADAFTLAVDSNQALSVVVTPGPALQPTVWLRDPASNLLSTATSADTGEVAMIQDVPLHGPGIYTLVVTGATSTADTYDVRLLLNASAEEESYGGASNDTLGAAQSMEGAFIAVGDGSGQRAAVLGTAQFPGVGPAETVFEEGFENGLGDFTINNNFGSGNGLWHASSGRQLDGLTGHTPPGSLYYGQGEDEMGGGTYDTGTANGGALFSPTIALPQAGAITLKFNYFLETEDQAVWDIAQVAIDTGSGYQPLVSSSDETFPTGSGGTWASASIDLSAYGGATVTLRFSFDTLDAFANQFEGWYIDDVLIEAAPFGNETADHYAFTLGAGETASILLTCLEPGSAALDLYDSVGSLMALAVPGVQVQQVISDFVAPAAGTYVARVRADDRDYGLLVTRGMGFDSGGNLDAVSAHPVRTTGRVLGHTAGAADWYKVQASDGDELTLRTHTPADGPLAFDNSLDPLIELQDPLGTPVALDDNSAPDGRNTMLVYTTAVAGTYSISLSAQGGSAGEYVFSVDGATGLPALFEVIDTDPAAGAVLPAGPPTMTVVFSDSLLLPSLNPEDLTIDLVPANAVSMADGRTAVFELPAVGHGPHEIMIPAGVL